MSKSKDNFVYIEYSSRSYDVGDYDPEDRWDRPDSETIYDVKGFVSRSHPNDGDSDMYRNTVNCLSVPFKPEIENGKVYFFVYAVYSTGDSFGYDRNGGIEELGLFERREDANRCRNMALEPEINGSHSIQLINNEGIEYKTHCPWFGYFENLEDIEVVPVIGC